MQIDPNGSVDDEAAVVAGLRAFNVERLGPGNHKPVRIIARDDAGRVIGGVIGETKWRWLYVSKLWVHESARGQGLGTKLMIAAEELARQRGCTDVSLDTFEFQARPFYEKLGYKLFGTLEGFPPGYRQYYLTKKL